MYPNSNDNQLPSKNDSESYSARFEGETQTSASARGTDAPSFTPPPTQGSSGGTPK